MKSQRKAEYALRCTLDLRDLLAWYEDDMRWCLRINIVERDARVVFVDKFRRNLAAQNLAEQCV